MVQAATVAPNATLAHSAEVALHAFQAGTAQLSITQE